MDEHLQSDVLDRLERDEALPDKAAHLALAALKGEVEDCLAGRTMSRPQAQPKPAALPVRAFIESITVEGFRGVGSRTTLSLRPSPGLTLIVGRNGSGKSSFAEALELLLTGSTQRWNFHRLKIWREGWRNLHHSQSTRIEAKLVLDGQAEPYIVTREWRTGDHLEDGSATVLHDRNSGPLASLGWEEALSAYRPFLSYTELGSMLEEGPSRLFDALASILGLEDLLAAADILRDTRAARTKVHKTVRDRLDEIRNILLTQSDERAAKCIEALSGMPWDLGRVSALLAEDHAQVADSEILNLRELANLQGPDPAAVRAAVQALKSAVTALDRLAHTNAENARRRAEILEKAIDLHEHEGDADCPVCGQTAALDAAWRREAREEAVKLRAEGEAADAAHRNLLHAERAARQWLTAPPAAVADAKLVNLWNTWKQGESKAGTELGAHLESMAPTLDDAIREIRRNAQAELQKREDRWRPAATALAEWLPSARKMVTELEAVDLMKSAEDWLRTTAARMHNERFQPIKERVKKIWDLLRTQSHVELEDVKFQGKSTSRRVNLDVNVDGSPATALGVMSQGELHALALSFFLPRATLERSPFRFLLIDDPVQSMDASRVDGLARVLEMVAKKRQVVIFTHDDRLREAIGRLQIKASVMEILRRERSVVEFHGR
jgi:recombinational DNA repair ATPase RecF